MGRRRVPMAMALPKKGWRTMLWAPRLLLAQELQ
jgi:hypothetical protein